MVSKLVVLSAALCAVQICWAALPPEKAPVTDPKLKEQGYTCQPKTGPPMKNEEVNNNYSPHICASATCSDGVLYHATCPFISVPDGGKLIQGDPSKPYPECCRRLAN